jgi:Flp pilus assembly protein TadG
VFKFLKETKGSAVVEVALMLPLVLMLVFGFMMFTHAVRINTVLEVAAREGARTLSITKDSSQATYKAKQELDLGGVDGSKASVSTSVGDSECRVVVKMPYPINVPIAGEYNLSLKGDAVFHREPDLDH